MSPLSSSNAPGRDALSCLTNVDKCVKPPTLPYFFCALVKIEGTGVRLCATRISCLKCFNNFRPHGAVPCP